ncbi:hypothetical protein G6N82_02550 [Altererythrobacter sp. BO-6]|uniref:hypothetical protein n=1 Tax=Altererythrobacter sp. BO-6 TaxID=2604537 RepID=UPI0013E18C6C|nr:hypothetical protein [Altererythrobacter sp. BO-6]QIG53182.1 hypothetical protein G6N82_02550 [Altererythrobacter sp. BO-6]
MNDENTQTGARSLAEIESDLLKAEKAFLDADSRFRKAQQDRRAALSTIDKHQDELDECLLALRQRSVPGTKWCLELGQADETLDLHSEDIVSEISAGGFDGAELVSDATRKAAKKDFDILRTSASANGEDPVLKVVSTSKG